MEYAIARHNMVESQVRTTGISDPTVIKALEAIPREVFVPKTLRGVAYTDGPLDLGSGRSLPEPRVLSSLLQAAMIDPDDVALDIGCGSGYSTAVLSRLSSSVVAVESDGDFVKEASAHLADLGIDNAAVVTGDLPKGFAKQGPYSVILINGGVERVPEEILQQLSEGGRLVTVLLDGMCGQGVVYTRRGDAFGCRSVFNAVAPALPGFANPKVFTF